MPTIRLWSSVITIKVVLLATIIVSHGSVFILYKQPVSLKLPEQYSFTHISGHIVDPFLVGPDDPKKILWGP